MNQQLQELQGWRKLTSQYSTLAQCALIVPTYSRPVEMVRLLGVVAMLEDAPGEFLIIDGSPDQRVNRAIQDWAADKELAFDLVYVKSPAGLTRQRNVGLDACTREFIYFLDDDCLPEPGYFESIHAVFASDTNGEIGAVRGFLTNGIGKPKTLLWRLRHALGVVPKGEPGQYHHCGSSGTWDMVRPFKGTRPVDLLSGGAAAYRREVFLKHRFSEFFYGYAQGEDMEMSLRIGKDWKMVVCGDARVDHRHAESGRPAGIPRGRMALRNRYFIWKRHSPDPGVRNQILFWMDHALTTAYYTASFLVRPWRPYYLGYALGTIKGAGECIVAPPRHQESSARSEYTVQFLRDECSTTFSKDGMNGHASTVRPLKMGGPQARVSEPVYVYRFSFRAFLFQLLFCTLPAAALLATGHADLAGKSFWLLFGIVLMRAVALGRRDEVLCFMMAAAPFLSLFRSVVFYNVIIATFLLVLGYYFYSASNRITQTLRQFRAFLGVVMWVGVYYGLSFYNTRDYSINLRLFELAFTIFCILLLSRNRLLLGVALTGMIISAWLVGMAMLPQMGTSDRLGIIEVEGRSLGNPGQLGMPLAFGFLALIFDEGRWLNLQRRPVYRWMMLGLTAALLALTTSRASWLVAATGVLILLMFGKKQRWKLISICIIGVLGISVVLMSPYAGALKKGWERTFGEGQSVRKKTSGRSDQWLVSKHAFTQSISTMVHGYGPGLGPQTYAKYSPEVPGVRYAVGKKVALHSLFMQLVVEVGLIGWLCFVVLLLIIFEKIVVRLREHGLFPLACFLGYVLTLVTVSGNDINSGILFGMALVGTAYSVSRTNGAEKREANAHHFRSADMKS